MLYPLFPFYVSCASDTFDVTPSMACPEHYVTNAIKETTQNNYVFIRLTH